MSPSISRDQVRFYLIIGGCYLVFWTAVSTIRDPETFLERLVNNCWLTCFLTLINFIFFEYVIPFIKPTTWRLLLTPFLIFASLLLYSFGMYFWRQFGVWLGIYQNLISHDSIIKAVTFHFPYSALSIVVFGTVKYVRQYWALKHKAQQLQLEKQLAELNFLKSQTNPHFLFNTLNNIYSLSRNKYELTRESILRLSKILRFMLYETNAPAITVAKELKIIEDYIALEKLRYDETVKIDLTHNISDPDQLIPPLLLMPLVENAFKHGASQTSESPFVIVDLVIQDNQLTFVVRNSTEQKGNGKVKDNIGLSNLKRQLQLLFTDYELNVQQMDFEFRVLLKINLSSHV